MKRKGEDVANEEAKSVIAQFVTMEGVHTGAPLDLPLEFNDVQLQELLNELLSNEDPMPFTFFVHGEEMVRDDLKTFLEQRNISLETTLHITYQPQAVFRVRPLTRCTSTLPGHSDSVLVVCFSPSGQWLASGSGDKTVRLWDLDTQTPLAVGIGHSHWVLCLAWASDESLLASGSHDSTLCIWDPHELQGYQEELKPRTVLRGHKGFVTSLAWEPLHRTKGQGCRRLVSSSKDNTARIWDALTGQCLAILSGHTASVTCVRWGGEGLIYTCSQDRTIMVFAVQDQGETLVPKVIRILKDHAHWVNHLALSTEHAMRTGPFDHTVAGGTKFSKEEAYSRAKRLYTERQKGKKELLVSCSDDYTMILWSPTDSNKPIQRMTGHQQLVNSVCFSPDGLHVASASFDKSVRLWNGVTGKFECTLRGHVGAVYGVVFSADSRLLLSSSKDTTVKLWSLKTRKLDEDLPGHEDEVFAVDWDPLGGSAASGGKDRVLKIWKGAA